MLALIIIAPSAPRKTSAIASRNRSRRISNRVARNSSNAASGASVLPAAMTGAVHTGGLSVTFTRNAPRNIPGDTRRPKTSRPTSAIPDGGHTGVTLVPTSAACRLSRAAA